MNLHLLNTHTHTEETQVSIVTKASGTPTRRASMLTADPHLSLGSSKNQSLSLIPSSVATIHSSLPLPPNHCLHFQLITQIFHPKFLLPQFIALAQPPTPNRHYFFVDFFSNSLNNLPAHLTSLFANHFLIRIRGFYSHPWLFLLPWLLWELPARVGSRVLGSSSLCLLGLLVCAYLPVLSHHLFASELALRHHRLQGQRFSASD